MLKDFCVVSKSELKSFIENNIYALNNEKFVLNNEVVKVYSGNSIVDEIEFVGLCTDICVVSNALALRMFYPNTKITVDASCCAGVTPEKHKAALEVMKSCQIDVIH